MTRSRIVKIALLPLLFPPSIIYAVLINLRNFCYNLGLFRIQRLQTKVISVGNIAAGGGGKSPFTMWLAAQLQKKGIKPAILSRGYGRSTEGTLLITSGSEILTDAQEGGDEPLMMARNLTGIPIVVDENRVRGGRYLEEHFKPDCIILDDALQHRKIHRDVEIVLWNSRQRLWDLLPLPLGHQRDSLNRIKKADLFILTKIESEKDRKKWGFLQRWHGIDALFRYQLQAPRDPFNGKEVILSRGKKALVISGIAFPKDLLKGLREKYPQTEFSLLDFPDHVKYTQGMVDKITRRAAEYDYLICTEKDHVKLEGYGMESLLVIAMELTAMSPDPGGEKILNHILSKIDSDS